MGQAVSDAKLSINERVAVASKVYSLLQLYFASNKGVTGPGFDSDYKTYLQAVLSRDDRRQFDLATVEFVAKLHSGHTFFWDTFLNQSNQQHIGFYAAPMGDAWVVQISYLAAVKPGDILTGIDDTPIETFFQQRQAYIAASSVAAQRHNLFLFPYLFPERFTATLDGGRKVTIDRAKIKLPEQKTEGRWLKPGTTAYIRIPAFFRLSFEFRALDYVLQFQNAATLIIDLRNNGGGIPPRRLIQALMDRPYREWKESTTARFPMVDLDPDDQQNRTSTMLPESLRDCDYAAKNHLCSSPLTWGGETINLGPHSFHGRVILLVDGGCVSACEEFLEPFKDSKRGIVIGDTTEGSSGVPYSYDFGNGMSLQIAVKRQYFPDGSEFEGVGIKPDIEMRPSINDLKNGKDPVLEKALELAETP